ncbi:hypothetical protein P8452_31444 [Trifolium repens]|nr:hypothetical protein P8452_31444 [Trifolium repens]
MVKNKKPKQQQKQSLRLLLLLDDTDSRNNRVMSQLRDSLLSQLTELHPTLPPSVLTRRSSFIQSRLQHLFHSFHTPTHPPYALMINRAIVELNDRNGSTEVAISDFVRREYEDLPWAHSKILSLHLKRLCQVGELACNEDGRYVFPVGGDEKKERGKGNRKRKRGGGSRRSNRLALLDSVETDEASTQVSESDYHSIGSVQEQIQVQSEKEIQSEELEQDSQTQLCQVGELACNEDDSGGEEEKEWGKGSRKRTRGGKRSDRLALLDVGTDEASTQVSESDHHSIGSVEEQIQVQSEKEVQCLEPNELEESQTQMVSNTICAEESPECIISTDDDQLPQDYNQGNTNGNLDENPTSECLELVQPKRKRGRPPKSETDANCQEDSSLHKQGPKRNKKQQKQDGLTRSRDPRGRPRKVIQVTEKSEEKLKKKEEKLKKKEEKLKKKDKDKLCRREEKLKKKDQAQLRDREEKLNTKYQAKLRDREEKFNKKDQTKLRGQSCGRGRGRGRGRGQGRPPKPKVLCDTIEEAPPAEATAM